MSFKEKVYRRTEAGRRVITIAKKNQNYPPRFDSKQNSRNFFCYTCCGLDVKHSQMQHHMIKRNIILILELVIICFLGKGLDLDHVCKNFSPTNSSCTFLYKKMGVFIRIG